MSAVGWRRLPPPASGDPEGACWRWRISRPEQLSRARKDLREHLTAGELADVADPDDQDRLLLMFEELASNGLRHGGIPVDVRVRGTGEGWLVDVCDAAPGSPPVPAVDRDPATGGLGLHLVARLAEQYGWDVDGAHKHVWACLGRYP
jgi:two-component sensor histidine kinase